MQFRAPLPHRNLGGASASILVGLLVLVASSSTNCRFAAVRGGGGADDGGAVDTAAVKTAISIRVDPPVASLAVINGQAATQPFRAYRKLDDGSEEDVTDSAAWSSDDSLRLTVSRQGLATTSTTAGGTARVTARLGGLQATAMVSITVELVTASAAGTPPLPADPGAAFGGTADGARAPELVYPNDGVLLPPNLGRVEVHFRPGSPANTLYEIAFRNDVVDVRVHTRCVALADGCVYETSPEVWSALAQSNRGGGPVALTVRGTDDAGSGVGTSAAFHLRWSRDPLMGVLYYWTTTTPVGIQRWNFGDARQTAPEKIVDPQAANGQCVGCHALSHDGAKMVMTSGSNAVGRLLLFDPVKKTALQPYPLPGQSWFEAWNPDGSAFVGVNGAVAAGNLILFDGTTGAQTGIIALGGARATHPDWSANGRRIVFTEIGQVHDDQTPGMGGISYVEQQSGGWSAPRRLVAGQAGVNRYYPTVAPDNTTVVFDESTCPAGRSFDQLCDADVDPSARLWAAPIPAAGSARAPVELAAANAPGVDDRGARDLTSTYPRWSPFGFQVSETQSLYWISFSSSRRYGLRSPVSSGEHHGNPTGVLMWLAAVDTQQVALGHDGSFPAFCLPFQSLDTSNHIAQWANAVPTVP